MCETWVWSLQWEDPLEKGKATHSNILAWKIPWTVWSMGSQRVGHNWVTFTFTFTPAEWVMGPVSVQPWASPAPPSLHGSLQPRWTGNHLAWIAPSTEQGTAYSLDGQKPQVPGLPKKSNLQNPALCDNMNDSSGHYARWNKSEKDKYCMISLICGI